MADDALMVMTGATVLGAISDNRGVVLRDALSYAQVIKASCQCRSPILYWFLDRDTDKQQLLPRRVAAGSL